MAEAPAPRRWLAPEVVQASPMDCGPAALHALASGFGLSVSYARLREACQTNVDGTSIDALEGVARELGLDALQVLVPSDHVGHARAETLPAIAVTRLPAGTVHFVLVWRRVGRFVQVMDPGSGRRWIEVESFRRTLYQYGVDLPAELWRRFAGSASSAAVLRELLASLGHRRARERVAEVLLDPHWRPLAALEAAARMARSLIAARALSRGAEAERVIDALFERARAEELTRHTAVPPVYWSVRAHAPAADGTQLLHVRGAILLRGLGLRAPIAPGAANALPALPRELAAAFSAPALSVGHELARELRGADRRALFGLALLAGGAALHRGGLVDARGSARVPGGQPGGRVLLARARERLPDLGRAGRRAAGPRAASRAAAARPRSARRDVELTRTAPGRGSCHRPAPWIRRPSWAPSAAPRQRSGLHSPLSGASCETMRLDSAHGIHRHLRVRSHSDSRALRLRRAGPGARARRHPGRARLRGAHADPARGAAAAVRGA
ncbi:MAG: hypothetical protein EXS08_06900 [Planctomycetes bacterium]|nr:hypothetical protein [Planctomycetota bacterium]